MTGDGPRTNRSLDGDWQFLPDPNETGLEADWQATDADWPDRATTISVPHVWQELDDFRDYTGTAWYRRRLTVESDERNGRHAYLRFDAVDYETTVWVNGERVGTNRGGYLPFEFDVTEALAEGENNITLSVTDPSDLSEIPHGKQGDPWYTRVSGIWQSVTLAYRRGPHVEAVHATPDLSTDTADVEVRLTDDVTTAELTCRVQALRDGEPVTAGTEPAAATTEVLLDFDDPAYWTPENPTCYDLVVEIVDEDGELIDRYEDHFGMRSFTTADGRFLLNGEPITMRGVLEQGYYPKTFYRPNEPDAFQREVSVAKDLGFNLIRKHIKPAHPEFLEEADRQGMLVWQEPANPARYTERSKQEVRAQLTDMIDRDYNRPSVVVWSLYNEEWGLGHHDTEETLWTDEEKQQFLADLYRSTRTQDPTRLVCDNSGWAHVATDVNDFHRYFASPDRADAWEADLDHICYHASDNYATNEFSDQDAPIVVSELGTWGLGDVSALRDAYDGDPPWFFHDFLTQAFKRPGDLDEKFASTGVSDVFDDYDELERVWQWREYVSIKHIIESMRERTDIAGYVLTELSDIEWEFNGILDYLRNEKVFYDDFRRVNSPLAVVADLDSHVTWTDEPLDGEITVVNDTDSGRTGTLEWRLGTESGSRSVTVDANTVTAVALPPLDVSEPEDGVHVTEFEASFTAAGASARTSEPVHIVDRDALEIPDATVFAEGRLASRLARVGVDVTHELSDAVDVVVTDTVTTEFEQFASDGGAVVHVPRTDGRMVSGGPISYRDVPEEESWIAVASLFYQDSALLADVCPHTRLGWEFEGLYPTAVATDLDESTDDVHVGYLEGWLTNWSSPLVVRDYGNGTVTALTFRVSETYGSNPIATLVCNRLLRRVTE